MLSPAASQPDYELDDFTAVSEWERFTANVEECLREWAPTSSTAPGSMSPTTLASTQQQLQSAWPQWLVRACDLGSVGGQRFELVRHWHESVVNEASKAPVNNSSPAPDGTVFLDLLDTRSDFDNQPNPEPYRLFGFRDFAILRVRQSQSSSSSTTPIYLSVQLSNLLLSSLASAATASSCSMPMLLELPSSQSGAMGRVAYSGISVSRVAIIDLNATLFNHPSRPPTHLTTQATSHLCYWIAVMRNHLRCPLWPQPPLQLSIRYSYYIRIQFPQSDPLQLTSPSGGSLDDDEDAEFYPDEFVDSEEDYEDGFIHSQQSTGSSRRVRRRRSSNASSLTAETMCANFCRLPFGIYDPSEAALEVILTWPCIDDSHFTDSPAVSSTSNIDLMTGVSSCRGCTLDPSTAVDWMAKLWLERQDASGNTRSNYSRCSLSDFVVSFAKMAGLGVSATPSSSSSLANQTEAASPAKPGQGTSAHWSMRLVKHLATATASAAAAAVPNQSAWLPELIRMLVDSWIFPKNEDSSQPAVVEVDVRDLKAGTPDSLIERVAIAACALTGSFGQSAAVQFWQHVAARLHGLWETGRPLPKTDAAIPPDLKQSLIAQKIQLLAYCLRQRLRRERDVTNASSAYNAGNSPAGPDARSDGRLRLLDPVHKTMLISGKDQIYVPETQEPEPMTEDELPMFPIESDIEPGTAGVGFQHSIPCLQSDMSSFKAANPGAELIDFLRWYSPRDVQNSSDGTPTLSSRMCIPDNIWQSTWEKARPIPARRQKRLFDETKAAHGALRWFSALGNSPRDLTLHLLPVVLGAALRKLLREAKAVLPSANALQHVPTSRYVKEAVDYATESVVKATNAVAAYALARTVNGSDGSGRSTPLDMDGSGSSPSSAANTAVMAAFEALVVAEQRVSLLAALRNKLNGAISAGDGHVLDEFLYTLVANCSAPYNGTPFPAPGKSPTVRGVVLSLISSEAPSPYNVGAVIRANCPRPAAFSRSLPHRMFVRFQPNSPTPSCSCLAAAFSRDIIFA